MGEVIELREALDRMAHRVPVEDRLTEIVSHTPVSTTGTDTDRQQGAVDIDAPRRSAEERVTMIQLSPDKAAPPNETTSGRRWPILAAAAVVLLVVGAIALVATRNDDATPADQPSPTVTVPPTTPPRSLVGAARPNEQLVPGTYFIDEVDGIFTPRIFITVGDGWSGSKRGVGFSRDGQTDNGIGDGGFIRFERPTNVHSDACHWEDGDRPGGRARTVDRFVAALTEQGGWADVTTPVDISIDGYAGKAFQRTVPTDISDCDTVGGPVTPETPDGRHPSFAYNRPGDIETVWVLDIGGMVVGVVAREYPEASAAARAEIAAVLDSIRIERR